ncbi:MAG: hypothetical protein KDB82_16525 [Planctomycetes bacterium]|nr:hypothetical protein [Planctomycetota bacterium]
MDEEPQFSKTARSDVPQIPYRWLVPVVAAPFALAGIGGLTWADAPAILAKGLIALGLCAVVITGVYFLFRQGR